ncbi:MAG: hypothetical protein AB1422_00730 [bacterium]
MEKVKVSEEIDSELSGFLIEEGRIYSSDFEKLKAERLVKHWSEKLVEEYFFGTKPGWRITLEGIQALKQMGYEVHIHTLAEQTLERERKQERKREEYRRAKEEEKKRKEEEKERNDWIAWTKKEVNEDEMNEHINYIRLNYRETIRKLERKLTNWKAAAIYFMILWVITLIAIFLTDRKLLFQIIERLSES